MHLQMELNFKVPHYQFQKQIGSFQHMQQLRRTYAGTPLRSPAISG